MGIIKWAEKKIHGMNIWDFSVLKTALIVLGMILGAFFSMFVKKYMLHFFITFIVLYTILIFRIFKK